MLQCTLNVPTACGVNETSTNLPGPIVVAAIPSSSDAMPCVPDVDVKRSVAGCPASTVIVLGVKCQFAATMSIDGCAIATAPDASSASAMSATVRRESN